jgi:nucleoid-associated protein YgaU
MAGRFILMLAAATVAAGTATQPSTCAPAQNASGKPGLVEYTTGPADSPYALAGRFYGRTWLAYQIAEINKAQLTQEGFFKPGVKIVIPPDLDGRPVDFGRMKKHAY